MSSDLKGVPFYNQWKFIFNLTKAAFVSAENGFEKTIYTLPCVWLRMKNMVKQKIISVDCKIHSCDP